MKRVAKKNLFSVLITGLILLLAIVNGGIIYSVAALFLGELKVQAGLGLAVSALIALGLIIAIRRLSKSIMNLKNDPINGGQYDY